MPSPTPSPSSSSPPRRAPRRPQEGPVVIGVTGGIAAGKTTVSRILAEEFGAHVISADEIGHQLLRPGEEVYEEVVRRHGGRVLNPDGTVNRRALARIVFSDRRELDWLNRLSHPRIVERVRRELSRLRRELPPGSLVVVDAALLFEMGLGGDVDYVIAVVAPDEVRLERLKAQGMAEGEARARMAAQMPQEEKAERADFVVDGSAPLEEVRKRLRETVTSISRPGGRQEENSRNR